MLTLKYKRKNISVNELKDAVPVLIEDIVNDMLNKADLIAHNPESKYCNYC